MSEHLLTEKRFVDLSRQAQRRGIVTFSDFLTLYELNILHQNASLYAAAYRISGGYELAERQLAAFLPDALYYDWEYPIDCLMLSPAYPKFAEQLSHRDILGAVMNLRIERAKIGDILVKEGCYYLFCKNDITSYLVEQLHQIRHTIINVTVTAFEHTGIQPDFEESEAVIASNRLDNVVSAMTKLSRSDAVQLIQSGKVFVQGKECLHNTYVCKEKDVLSIRSFGKFIFDGEQGLTRKNRLKISYKKYR